MTATSHALLRVEDVTKRFGRFRALSDVSFSVRRGEILGLIGPNGAGKTTLFECLAGVLPADGGTVHHGERSITPSDRSSFLFYLPDGIAPWPSQSVRWALDFALGFFGGSTTQREANHSRFVALEAATRDVARLETKALCGDFETLTHLH